MGSHHHNRKAGGLDMIELFIAVAAIILFWIGFKFGMKSAAELLSDHQGEFWFGIVSLAVGIISGFIPAGVFAGCCLGIVAFLKKQKTNKE